jgi:hypothetical protein
VATSALIVGYVPDYMEEGRITTSCGAAPLGETVFKYFGR